MVNTIEIALANKMHEALTAYGLAPNEATADIKLITSVTDAYNGRLQSHKDKYSIIPLPFHSDSLYIEIGTRRVHDPKRKEAVIGAVKAFVLDFIAATGLDVKKCVNADPEIGYGNEGGYGFRVEDVANSSLRQGRDRAVDDVWYGLEQMIRNKGKSWAKSA